MNDFKEILGAVETPHLVFLFGLVFVLLFRAPLSDLIRRIRSIDRRGLTAGPDPNAQREEANPEAVHELLEIVGNTPVITDLEERIRADLDARQIGYDSNSARVLIRHLAGTQLLLYLEQVHASIFGSQIQLLKRLNEVAGQGQSEKYVQDFIDNIKSMYPDSLGDWSHEDYLQFLLNQGLVFVQEDRLHITDFGVEYLTWIVRSGRAENRAL